MENDRDARIHAWTSPRDPAPRRFHPRYGDRACFVGWIRPSTGGVPAQSEMVARYFALLASGKRKLPEDWLDRLATERTVEDELMSLGSCKTLVHHGPRRPLRHRRGPAPQIRLRRRRRRSIDIPRTTRIIEISRRRDRRGRLRLRRRVQLHRRGGHARSARRRLPAPRERPARRPRRVRAPPDLRGHATRHAHIRGPREPLATTSRSSALSSSSRVSRRTTSSRPHPARTEPLRLRPRDASHRSETPPPT